MRYSNNHCDASGALVDGFDYDLQVWVSDGRIQACGHVAADCGCNARRFAGEQIGPERAIIAGEQTTRGDASGEHVVMAGDAFTTRIDGRIHWGAFARDAHCNTCGESMNPSNRPAYRHVSGATVAQCRMVPK